MDNEIVYSTAFDANEWVVLAMILGGAAAILALPKRFTPTQTMFTLSIGVTLGFVFDHTLALPPIDLYDVGDKSGYQLFDVFSYLMYAPFGYFFIYFHDRWRVRGYGTIPYIALWLVGAILLEWICVLAGIFHYKNGYKLLYSTPIYAYLQIGILALYKAVFSGSRPSGSASIR